MSTNEIIQYVIDSEIIPKCTAKWDHPTKGYRNDMMQDIYLILLELPEERLQRLYDNNELLYYVASICRNQFMSKKSQLRKKYELNLTKINYDKYATEQDGTCDGGKDDEEYDE